MTRKESNRFRQLLLDTLANLPNGMLDKEEMEFMLVKTRELFDGEVITTREEYPDVEYS